jgi:hypothetical protein
VNRIFLLSTANCGGTRAKQLLSPRADFPLAQQLRSPDGAPLGDLFAFVSGLYFRGKLTYSRRFALPPAASPVVRSGIYVITPNRGLQSPDTFITRERLSAFAGVDVHPDTVEYRRPLERSARKLARAVDESCHIVLLGSIASAKYVDVLLEIFGERLTFPSAFVGRGDMSRGGLLLRKAAEGVELEYVPVAGAVRHGPRPPKLEPLRRVGAQISRQVTVDTRQ